MTDRRSIILGVFATLVAAAIVRADMVPMCPCDDPACSRSAPSARIPNRCVFHTSRPTPVQNAPFHGSYVISVSGLLPAGYSHEGGWEDDQIDGTQAAMFSSDQQNGTVLCLYGLLAFGAFRSVSRVKTLSFGFIPDWYYTGGPAQMGHSNGVVPDCSRLRLTCCFVQPQADLAGCQPEYFQGTIAFLRRDSQSMSLTLTSRAPPRLLH